MAVPRVFHTMLIVMMTTCISFHTPAQADEQPGTLRVMSFNIRYGSARDGLNAWEYRKEFLVETIQKFQPDLLGTQETEWGQKEYLAEQLSGYIAFGAGRDDGAEKGETMTVFYRSDRFTRLDGGHFWLSETPEVPGSKSWDSSLPRMATWLKLQDNTHPEKAVVWFFNTHFDHRGPESRAQAGCLIRDRIAAIPDHPIVIVTGDFNSGEGSPAYQNLFAPVQGRPLLQDAYRLAHPQKSDEEVTFNKFQPDARKGNRIDWMAITPRLSVDQIEINHVSRDGRVPSDHFPIEAVLKYAR